jgi:Mg2+ and Co2+ transporter CorA
VDMAMDLGADVATALLRRIGEQRDELAGLRDVLNRQREQIEGLGSTPIEDLSESERIGRIRRSVRAISERHQSVMALRRRWWWAVERSRTGKAPESAD